jgi:hypothetical protein
VIFSARRRIHKYTKDGCEVFFVRGCSFVYLCLGKLFLLAQDGYTLNNDNFFICVFVKFYLWHK